MAALSQTTLWIDDTGDWFNPSNWSAGVPAGNDAQINNGGTAQITASGAMASSLTLAQDPGTSGNMVIDGPGTLSVDNSTFVGNGGNATFTISGGGTLTSGLDIIGATSGSGTMTVTGSGSTWESRATMFVGAGTATGTVNILNQGTVNSAGVSIGEDAGCKGFVNVDGAGSTWSTAILDVGGEGTGALKVTNGGSVFSIGTSIGRNPGSVGVVTVDGAGSNLTMTTFGALVVGNFGTGTLDVTNGGTVSSSVGFVGASSDAVAFATIDGLGSKWTISGQLNVGGPDFDPHAVGAAVLKISNGGAVSDVNGYIGSSSNTNGTVATVIVSGAGSTWDNSGNVFVGGNDNGPGGPAVLHVDNGGTVNAQTTTVLSPGRLEGNGTVTGSVINFGTIDPAGVLHVGSYSQDNSSTLDIALQSLSSYDLLAVSDFASLDGTLDVTLNGYTGHVGDVFTILTSSGLSGNFSNIEFPILSGGLFFTEQTTANDVLLTVHGRSSVPDADSTVSLMLIAFASCWGARQLISRKSPLSSSNH
jgi:T5SS/PEP-CTERM-associated repeat protein